MGSSGCMNEFTVVFLDDILVFLISVEEHEKNMR